MFRKHEAETLRGLVLEGRGGWRCRIEREGKWYRLGVWQGKTQDECMYTALNTYQDVIRHIARREAETTLA